MKNFIKIINTLLSKDNIRDYLVIILMLSYIYFIKESIEVPSVFYTILGTAVGYYFRGKK